MKEEFLKICNEVFEDDISNRACEIAEYGGAKYEKAYQIAKEEYNEKFSELCDRLIKLFI